VKTAGKLCRPIFKPGPFFENIGPNRIDFFKSLVQDQNFLDSSLIIARFATAFFQLLNSLVTHVPPVLLLAFTVSYRKHLEGLHHTPATQNPFPIF